MKQYTRDVIIHEEFSDKTAVNDIALIRLHIEIVFNGRCGVVYKNITLSSSFSLINF